MPKITKNLNYTEVKYGNLKIPLRFRNLVPPPSRLVRVVDDADGEKFFCHMHRQQPGRIDGLTKLYRKHRSSAVIIEFNERETKTVHIYCKAVSKKLPSPHNSEEYLIGRIPYRMEWGYKDIRPHKTTLTSSP
jgi:hypothetical protein